MVPKHLRCEQCTDIVHDKMHYKPINDSGEKLYVYHCQYYVRYAYIVQVEVDAVATGSQFRRIVNTAMSH